MKLMLKIAGGILLACTVLIVGCSAIVGTAVNSADHSTTTSMVRTSDKESKLTTSQEQAIESAEGYLDSQSFSKTGLMKQLKFEDFPAKDAKFAVNHIKVDWNEQAAKSAAGYLETSHFSKVGLIGQLKFEGFTQSQAEYGVDKAYTG